PPCCSAGAIGDLSVPLDRVGRSIPSARFRDALPGALIGFSRRGFLTRWAGLHVHENHRRPAPGKPNARPRSPLDRQDMGTTDASERAETDGSLVSARVLFCADCLDHSVIGTVQEVWIDRLRKL